MPKENVARVTGKILSDPVFRKAFAADPDGTLKEMGLTLPAGAPGKLKELATKMGAAKRGAPGGEQNLHVNVASSVGYA